MSASRVVSLVPSLTESIAATAPGLLVGATDWCTHPADLDVVRIGGTKNPRVDDIVALQPDLVVANEEENRAPDIAALRDRGLNLVVTSPVTVAEALDQLDDLLTVACGLDRPDWLVQARAAWHSTVPGPTMSAVIPIWRRPWMVLGRDTFAGDLLARLDIENVFAHHDERYPTVSLDEIRRHEPDIVLLPDEPYRFGPSDGPEAFADWGIPIACISGRHLTWYGPSLVEARAVIIDGIAAAATV
ncbi:MAG: cobalamin-binding protein [Frankiaceae bacterium]|nr:cobalamin-binding protein [Frankiaceae bacterium]